MKSNRKGRLYPLLALVVSLVLVGCGWQLRGSYKIPEAIKPIEVQGGGVAAELRDSLRYTEALAGNTDEPPGSRVEILKENNSRRVLSVDIDGKVDEYEVRYRVRWQLTAEGGDDNSRRILIAPITFGANRSYDYDPGAVLSRSEQEARLIENMRDDVAQRILFRLQGVEINQPDNSPRSEDGD